MLWLFGIHQAVIYSAIPEPLLLINITENIAAANNGQAIPHIINLSQAQTFALMGGRIYIMFISGNILSEPQRCF